MKLKLLFSAIVALMFQPLLVADSQVLQDPDGKEANMSKPVQVYILMGQSNMLGFGKTGAAASGGKKGKKKKGKGGKAGGKESLTLKKLCTEKNMYPHLVDDGGNWTVRKDVRNVRVMGGKNGMQVLKNEWMTISGRTFGPEYGIGHHVGQVTDAPVMILKSCIGNRSLGWDLLPPGSKQYTYEGKVIPGYGENKEGKPKSETPDKWYAGKQWDTDIGNAKKVLADIGKYYPGATKFEVAGFCWWQGDKDFRSAAHAHNYEKNLVHLIKALREEFNSPNANFVCATLGQTKKGASGNLGKVLDGTLAVDGKSGKYPAHKGNVASVYTNPLSKGGSSSAHYGGNPETYMNVGNAMGQAMANLITGKSGGTTASK